MIVHIYIFGEIQNEQSEYAAEWGYVSLSNVVNQMKSFPDATEYYVHIHSRGGDVNEGFAIYDVLVNSGKKVTTHIEGLCASIATVISLAGTKRLMNKHSEFFIHNPWAHPFNMTGYTADDYEEQAEEIRIAEKKLVDFYVDKTGADLDTLTNMMKEETTMTADQAMEMKFITEIISGVSAMALIRNTKLKTIKMSDAKKSISSLEKVLAFLKGDTKALKLNAMKELTLKDGTKIEVDTDGEPAVGDGVSVNGEAAPDGDMELSDGTIYVIAAGKIAEIKPAAAAEDAAAEDAAAASEAKAKIAELTNQLATATSENAKLTTDLKTISEKVDQVIAHAASVSSGFKPEQRHLDKDKPSAEETPEQIVARRTAARIAAKKAK